MRRHASNRGFMVVELLIAIVVVAGLGFLAYTVISRQQTKTVSSSASSQQPAATSQPAIASDVSSTPAISSTSDLDTALTTVNQNDPSTTNGDDGTQLSGQAEAF